MLVFWTGVRIWAVPEQENMASKTPISTGGEAVMFAFLRVAAALTGLVLFAGLAHAQTDDSQPWDKFAISLGGFLTTSDTTLQLNSETLGVGAVINIENVLGVESSLDTYRLDTRYRFGETRRHELEFHYFTSNRDGSKTLDQPVQIGDEIFPAGTGVFTEFELQFANLDYVYNFLMDDRVRLGVSLGLHTTGIRLKVAETGGTKFEEEEFTAPLPMIGFRSEVILAKRWRAITDLNLFYLEYDRYTGRLADAYFALEWRPWKRFGLGAAINAIDYEVEADSDADLALGGWNGQLEYRMTGFLLYGKYFF
jgi:hypothetical protein